MCRRTISIFSNLTKIFKIIIFIIFLLNLKLFMLFFILRYSKSLNTIIDSTKYNRSDKPLISIILPSFNKENVIMK